MKFNLWASQKCPCATETNLSIAYGVKEDFFSHFPNEKAEKEVRLDYFYVKKTNVKQTNVFFSYAE